MNAPESMSENPNPPHHPPARRRRWLRWTVDICLILAVVLAVQAWRTRDVPDGPVPNFHLLMLDGHYVTLDEWRARHPDSAVALYFWADWCPICRTVEGSIDALSRDWPVLTVAMQSGNPPTVRKHLKQRGLAWDTAVDEHGRIAADLGIRGVPTMLIIDRDGRTRFAEVGFSTETGLRLRLWWADRTAG